MLPDPLNGVGPTVELNVGLEKSGNFILSGKYYNFSWAKPSIVSCSKTGFELCLGNIFEVRKPV